MNDLKNKTDNKIQLAESAFMSESDQMFHHARVKLSNKDACLSTTETF